MVQTCLVAAMRVEDQRGTSCQLRRCDERTRVNTCVNKSLVQALESCPSSVVSLPAVLPNLVPSRGIRSQLT